METHVLACGEMSEKAISEQLSGNSPCTLYVLGDLFEAWAGDDDAGPEGEMLYRDVADQFAQAAALGWAVKLMVGNRDFLLGTRFARQAGASLLADPTTVTLADGLPTLLMHGDSLCTDDHAYMAWRETCRSAAWQETFLAMSLTARRAEFARLRALSKSEVQAKSALIMDVNQSSVETALHEAGVTRLIHGHTHRPDTHRFTAVGKACERWVLPDWYTAGGFVRVTSSGIEFASV